MIVTVTTDGDVLLIRQYRYTARKYLIESSAGMIDAGESIEDAAVPELREETGHGIGSLRLLTTVDRAPVSLTSNPRSYSPKDAFEFSNQPWARADTRTALPGSARSAYSSTSWVMAATRSSALFRLASEFA